METKTMKPYDYLLRAKAAMRRHKSRQASECAPIEDDSSRYGHFYVKELSDLFIRPLQIVRF